jgi:hypothetical protein
VNETGNGRLWPGTAEFVGHELHGILGFRKQEEMYLILLKFDKAELSSGLSLTNSFRGKF